MHALQNILDSSVHLKLLIVLYLTSSITRINKNKILLYYNKTFSIANNNYSNLDIVIVVLINNYSNLINE